MAIKIGMQCKAYLGGALLAGKDAAAVAAVTTWAELTNVTDVTLNLSTDEADVTTRGNDGWKQTVATLKDGSVEFKMNWDNTDASFSTIFQAWLTTTPVAAMFLTGARTVPGEDGLCSNYSITNCTREETLTGAVQASVTLKPHSQTQWYTVPAA